MVSAVLVLRKSWSALPSALAGAGRGEVGDVEGPLWLGIAPRAGGFVAALAGGMPNAVVPDEGLETCGAVREKEGRLGEEAVHAVLLSPQFEGGGLVAPVTDASLQPPRDVVGPTRDERWPTP